MQRLATDFFQSLSVPFRRNFPKLTESLIDLNALSYGSGTPIRFFARQDKVISAGAWHWREFDLTIGLAVESAATIAVQILFCGGHE